MSNNLQKQAKELWVSGWGSAAVLSHKGFMKLCCCTPFYTGNKVLLFNVFLKDRTAAVRQHPIAPPHCLVLGFDVFLLHSFKSWDRESSSPHSPCKDWKTGGSSCIILFNILNTFRMCVPCTQHLKGHEWRLLSCLCLSLFSCFGN